VRRARPRGARRAAARRTRRVTHRLQKSVHRREVERPPPERPARAAVGRGRAAAAAELPHDLDAAARIK